MPDELFDDWQEMGDVPPEELQERLQAIAQLETFLDLAVTAESPSPMPSALGGETASAQATGPQPPLLGAPGYPFLEPPQAEGEIGRLGGYRILRVLGEGGMGVVFEAEEPRPLRRVALKVMKPNVAVSESARRRFLQEGQAAATVEHPRIVPIYRVDEVNGVPSLVMPFLRGESLESRLRRGRLPMDEAVRIGREMAEGLAAAHAAGLIHRDVKPSNVWLREDTGSAVLLDFGLARVTASNEEPLTQAGAVMGSPGYIAPEQAAGTEIDARADLFSLGCVLYRMLTGRAAFSGKDLLAALRSVAVEQPPPPHALGPGVSPELSDLVMRLLAKDPAERPKSAQEVVTILRRLEPGQGVPTAEYQPPAPTPRPWRRPVIAGIAGLLLVAAAAIGFAVLNSQPRRQPAPTGPDDRGGVPPVVAREDLPLKGELIVRVWTKDKRKRGLRIGEDAGAVPVREDEQLHLEARLNQPAYVYTLWVDGNGVVTPLHPWNVDRYVHESIPDSVPSQKPTDMIHNPPREDMGWPVDDTEGLDTMLLLARKTPLPEGVRLAEKIGKLSGAPLARPHEVVVRGFDRGLAVDEWKLDQDRRPKGDAEVIDDQLRQLVERLKGDFELIRAVQFAHVR